MLTALYSRHVPFHGAGRNLVYSLHTNLTYTMYQRLIHEHVPLHVSRSLALKCMTSKMATKRTTK